MDGSTGGSSRSVMNMQYYCSYRIPNGAHRVVEQDTGTRGGDATHKCERSDGQLRNPRGYATEPQTRYENIFVEVAPVPRQCDVRRPNMLFSWDCDIGRTLIELIPNQQHSFILRMLTGSHLIEALKAHAYISRSNCVCEVVSWGVVKSKMSKHGWLHMLRRPERPSPGLRHSRAAASKVASAVEVSKTSTRPSSTH
ncbi:uncharacterized protein PGTG_09053 [Puccinia graminis f. sp. tritici CRL 75-36-700-3]|uniref:Uncharacterized protein n=1 Tax=Puccinia graminis f. sp. tritici (strain CRL 75-36-700-3 / race SCCL) TaxID=418459 RepID=E3KFN6_PUCGT|nr:uncharacterized protein PGTG_09053 [Puccinia graminis f. sp. tritici CRL 75-36-700-3]EFP83100.2 hypothetical protein PGTG_09053 [Puccinia graminis f. sp. tritici CRL 75-36-700-3]